MRGLTANSVGNRVDPSDHLEPHARRLVLDDLAGYPAREQRVSESSKTAASLRANHRPIHDRRAPTAALPLDQREQLSAPRRHETD